MKEKIYVNGYEYWIDISSNPVKLYETKNADHGVLMDSVTWTKDERRQIREYMLYRSNLIKD